MGRRLDGFNFEHLVPALPVVSMAQRGQARANREDPQRDDREICLELFGISSLQILDFHA